MLHLCISDRNNHLIGLKWLISSTYCQESLSLNPGWNNSWLDFTYVLAKLRIIRAPFPWKLECWHQNKSNRNDFLVGRDMCPRSSSRGSSMTKKDMVIWALLLDIHYFTWWCFRNFSAVYLICKYISYLFWHIGNIFQEFHLFLPFLQDAVLQNVLEGKFYYKTDNGLIWWHNYELNFFFKLTQRVIRI